MQNENTPTEGQISDKLESESELRGAACSPSFRMDAYYYGFDPTGVEAIDRILCAVASAGKAYHHTQDWNEEQDHERENCEGKSPVDWIQNAANSAAKILLENAKCAGTDTSEKTL